MLSQTITVPTVGSNPGFTAVQSYTYDSLNRLKDAKEMIGATQTWRQTFTFDRYGNRNFDQANTTYPTSFAQPNITNPTVNQANNRFAARQGWAYDASGNTTADATGQTFVYDAENKQIQVNGPGGVVGQYFFDGDGKRVKKVVPATNETTIFVYDAVGQLVAEYSTTFEQSPGVKYLTQDHLGSPRVITDANGSVTSRRDFHAYGEEVFTAQRTAALGYPPDPIRQKFTTYERDTESDLDFAQARYYSSRLGRFFSIDPGNADADQEVPQSWNAYAYARNNPLKYGDPSGEGVEVCSVGGERTCVYYSEAQWIKFLDANKKSGDFTIKGNKIFFGDEIAAEITSSSFLDDRQKEFISSTAENSVKKGKVVGALGAGAVVTGACIGTGVCAVIGSALVTRIGSRIGAQAVEKAIERIMSNPNILPRYLPISNCRSR